MDLITKNKEERAIEVLNLEDEYLELENQKFLLNRELPNFSLTAWGSKKNYTEPGKTAFVLPKANKRKLSSTVLNLKKSRSKKIHTSYTRDQSRIRRPDLTRRIKVGDLISRDSKTTENKTRLKGLVHNIHLSMQGPQESIAKGTDSIAKTERERKRSKFSSRAMIMKKVIEASKNRLNSYKEIDGLDRIKYDLIKRLTFNFDKENPGEKKHSRRGSKTRASNLISNSLGVGYRRKVENLDPRSLSRLHTSTAKVSSPQVAPLKPPHSQPDSLFLWSQLSAVRPGSSLSKDRTLKIAMIRRAIASVKK